MFKPKRGRRPSNYGVEVPKVLSAASKACAEAKLSPSFWQEVCRVANLYTGMDTTPLNNEFRNATGIRGEVVNVLSKPEKAAMIGLAIAGNSFPDNPNDKALATRFSQEIQKAAIARKGDKPAPTPAPTQETQVVTHEVEFKDEFEDDFLEVEEKQEFEEVSEFTPIPNNPVIHALLDAVKGQGFDVKEALAQRKVETVEVIREVEVERIVEVQTREPITVFPANEVIVGNYVKPSYFDKVTALVDMGETVNLVGPSGCGKSTFWGAYAASRGLKHIVIDCGLETSTKSLVGFRGLASEGDIFRPGKIVSALLWDESDVLLELSELDFLPAEQFGCLHRILAGNADGTRSIDVPDAPEYGSEFTSKRKVILALDSNTNGRKRSRVYQGTQLLNAATLDRWLTVNVDYENEDKIIAPLCGEEKARKIVSAATVLRAALKQTETSTVFTTRGVKRVANFIRNGFTAKDAFFTAFEGKIEDDEVSALGILYTSDLEGLCGALGAMID